MCLSEAKENLNLKIKDIISGQEVRRKLLMLGLHIDDRLMKVSNRRWGPVMIKILSDSSESRIAIGRGLAEKIIVEYE